MILSLIIDEAPLPFHRGGLVTEPGGKRRSQFVAPARLELKRQRVVFHLANKMGGRLGPTMPALPGHILPVLFERAANRIGISTEVGIQVNRPRASHVRGLDLRWKTYDTDY